MITLKSNDYIKSMEEDLDQIEKNETWTLVPKLVDNNVIGTN